MFAYLTADLNLRLWGSTIRRGRIRKARRSRFTTALALVAVLSRKKRAPFLLAAIAVLLALLFGWSIRLLVLRIASFLARRFRARCIVV